MAETLRLIRNYCNQDSVTFTASTEDSEFPVENLRDQLRSKVWRTTLVDDQSVIVDLGTEEEIDSFAVLFRANQVIRLTGGAVIRIEGNASPSFASPLYSQVLTLDNENGVISHFLETPESHRYWRLFIDDPGNPYGGLEIAQLVLGKALKFDGAARGFKWGLIDPSNSQRTAFGQKYSDVLPTRKTFEFELPIEDFDHFEDAIEFYESVGITESFLTSLDSAEAIYTNKDRFLIWGTFEENFNATDIPSAFFTMGFKIEEQL